MEIERKFLLSGVPPTMRFARREPMRQGYLALDGDTEVRIRISPKGAVLTIKSGRGGVRVEEEIALDTRQAERLWELTEGRRVQKSRRRVRLAGTDGGPTSWPRSTSTRARWTGSSSPRSSSRRGGRGADSNRRPGSAAS